MIKNKIHIFYRHYNITGTELRRPQWFNYEKCFLRLLETIKDNDKVILHIVYDNKIQGYNWINKYKDNFNFIEFEGGSDWASFIKVGSILEAYNIQESDLIYILENDYIHVDGWVDKVFELFNTFSNLNYVSLYDHKDKYFLPQYDNLASKIVITDTHHWRTTPSTCASFIIDQKIYYEDKDILFTLPGDHNKFTYLNQTRNRFVITPIPGLSTHCMEGLMSPTIDWSQI